MTIDEAFLQTVTRHVEDVYMRCGNDPSPRLYFSKRAIPRAITRAGWITPEESIEAIAKACTTHKIDGLSRDDWDTLLDYTSGTEELRAFSVWNELRCRDDRDEETREDYELVEHPPSVSRSLGKCAAALAGGGILGYCISAFHRPGFDADIMTTTGFGAGLGLAIIGVQEIYRHRDWKQAHAKFQRIPMTRQIEAHQRSYEGRIALLIQEVLGEGSTGNSNAPASRLTAAEYSIDLELDTRN